MPTKYTPSDEQACCPYIGQATLRSNHLLSFACPHHQEETDMSKAEPPGNSTAPTGWGERP